MWLTPELPQTFNSCPLFFQVERVQPADPGMPDSAEVTVPQAGQVRGSIPAGFRSFANCVFVCLHIGCS